MLLNKLRTLVAVLLALSVIGSPVSVWAYQTLGAGEETARIHALKNPMATGQKEVPDPAPTLRATVKGHGKRILCAAISTDGKVLASGDLGGHVKLLDVATGKEKTTLKLPGAVMCVTFSNDGKLLACGGRSYESSFGGGRRSFLKLWDVATGKEKANFEGHGVGPSILSVAFSGDGKLLASGATDGTAKLWDVATSKEKASLWHPGDVTLALS